MKFDKPENPNYCATVVSVPSARVKLNGLDNLEGVSIFGYQVLVGKDTKAGSLAVFFPAETQLSDEYCYENNLFRHDNLNKIQGTKGYFEENRRVRAIKFKGNPSNGFVMPIESLAYTGIKVDALIEGDEFDTLNGRSICRKYVVPHTERRAQAEKVDRGFVRSDKKFMPEHFDTENFFKNADKIDPETEVIVTQKIHGTSIRIANTFVNRKLTLVERVAEWLGAKVVTVEHDYLFGSKRVIKDANNPYQLHYYSTDIWSMEGQKYSQLLPENYILYGELIGWTPEGKEIQKNYTYAVPKACCELYVYRIAIVNSKGFTTDLSWEQVKEFCRANGLKHVPELFKCKMKELTANDFAFLKTFLDARFFDGINLRHTLWLGDNELVDEGICVRAEGLTPRILKAKSPKFLEHETKLLDEGDEDLESEQVADGVVS